MRKKPKANDIHVHTLPEAWLMLVLRPALVTMRLPSPWTGVKQCPGKLAVPLGRSGVVAYVVSPTSVLSSSLRFISRRIPHRVLLQKNVSLDILLHPQTRRYHHTLPRSFGCKPCVSLPRRFNVRAVELFAFHSCFPHRVLGSYQHTLDLTPNPLIHTTPTNLISHNTHHLHSYNAHYLRPHNAYHPHPQPIIMLRRKPSISQHTPS